MAKPEDILEKVLSGELTRQEAVELQPDMTDRITMLTELAGELERLPHHQPDVDFRLRTRLTLLRHIQDSQHNRSAWRQVCDSIASLPQWASRAIAVVLAGGALASGVGFASASALPDDALYPVKRAVEQVQVVTARSNEARANLYLELADRRAAEIAAVADTVNEAQLDSLASDYGSDLQNVNSVVQSLSEPPGPLLAKVQVHIASQANELEARALNSPSKPHVQVTLAQAEVVASNVDDHVTLVTEQTGKPGPQDVHLAANPRAAATAGAEVATAPAKATPTATSVPTSTPTTLPSVKDGALSSVATGASPASVTTPTASPAAGPGNTEYDHLWNEVANAPFMASKVRTQVEVAIAAAKQDARSGKTDAAVTELNTAIATLQAAAKANQATQYTAARLAAEAQAMVAALKAADSAPASSGSGLRLGVVPAATARASKAGVAVTTGLGSSKATSR